VYNRWALNEGEFIERAALKVFGKVAKQVSSSVDTSRGHLLVRVSGHGNLEVKIGGGFVVDASALVVTPGGVQLGQFQSHVERGPGKFIGKVNDPVALENAYIDAFSRIASQITSDDNFVAYVKGDLTTLPAAGTSLEMLLKNEHYVKVAKNPAPSSTLSYDAPSGPLDFGSYHALVIGNNDYKYLPKLRTATNDAQTIASLLQDKYGFRVKLLINATRADILVAINSYRRTLTLNDNFLIYYAGHGWLDKDAGQGYWLPVNAIRDNQVEWVSNSAITSEIRAIQAKHVMVVADSCYSGKLARGLHISQQTPNYLARISQKKARVVLSSGGLEPVMDSGGKMDHSVFASAFIEALSENNDVLDGTSLFARIREQVGWNADQIPEYSNIHKAGHDGGDFLFVRKK